MCEDEHHFHRRSQNTASSTAIDIFVSPNTTPSPGTACGSRDNPCANLTSALITARELSIASPERTTPISVFLFPGVYEHDCSPHSANPPLTITFPLIVGAAAPGSVTIICSPSISTVESTQGQAQVSPSFASVLSVSGSSLSLFNINFNTSLSPLAFACPASSAACSLSIDSCTFTNVLNSTAILATIYTTHSSIHIANSTFNNNIALSPLTLPTTPAAMMSTSASTPSTAASTSAHTFTPPTPITPTTPTSTATTTILPAGALSIVYLQATGPDTSFTLTSSSFSNNKGTGHGGAMLLLFDQSSAHSLINISHSTFTNNINNEPTLYSTNFSQVCGGGAISIVHQGPATSTLLSVSQCSFTGSTSMTSQTSFCTENNGGAVRVHFNATSTNTSVAIMSNTFSSNTISSNWASTTTNCSNYGGALSITHASNSFSSSTLLTSNIFSGNTIKGSQAINYGGASSVAFQMLAQHSLVRSTHEQYSANTIQGSNSIASSYGGAIALTFLNTAISTANIFIALTLTSNQNTNSAVNIGGGLSVLYQGSALDTTDTFTAVTARGNINYESTSAGGALSVWYAWESTGAHFALTNSSFTSNENAGYFQINPNGGQCTGGAVSVMFIGTIEATHVTLTNNSFTNNGNTIGQTTDDITTNSFAYIGGAVAIVATTNASNVAVDFSHNVCVANYNNLASSNVAGGCLAVQFPDTAGLIENTSIVIQEGVFSNNFNTLSSVMEGGPLGGGAVSISCSAATNNTSLSILETIFDNNINQAVASLAGLGSSAWGGAVSIEIIGSTSFAQWTLTGNAFISNRNTAMWAGTSLPLTYGGAIYMSLSDSVFEFTLDVSNNVFQNSLNANVLSFGTSSVGAAAFLSFSGGGGGSATLSRVLFSNNTFLNNTNAISSSASGGALCISSQLNLFDFTLQFVNNIFSNNSNQGQFNTGSALALIATGSANNVTVLVQNCTFDSSQNLNNNYNNFGLASLQQQSNLNYGSLAIDFQGPTTFAFITITGCRFTNNLNSIVNSNQPRLSINMGAGALVMFNSTVMSSSIHVRGNIFINNTNTIGNCLSGTIQYGAAFALYMNTSNTTTTTISENQFFNSTNMQFVSSNDNVAVGPHVGVVCWQCCNSSISILSSSFTQSNNIVFTNHLKNSLFGGAVGVLMGNAFTNDQWSGPFQYTVGYSIASVVTLTNLSFQTAYNMANSTSFATLSGGAVAVNFSVGTGEGGSTGVGMGASGSAVGSNLGGNNADGLATQQALLRVSQLSFKDCDNVLFASSSSVTASTLFTNIPSSLVFFSSTTSLTLTYTNTFPQDSILSLGNASFSISSLCARQSPGLSNVQCNLLCRPGLHVANLQCVPPTSNENLFSLGECAGIGVGMGLGTLVAVVVVSLWGRRMLVRTRRGFERISADLNERLLDSSEKNTQLELEVSTLRKAWEIAWSDLVLSRELGRGAFGTVFAAQWRDMRVAVKTVAASLCGSDGSVSTNPMSGEIDREISMLQTVRHPNIVLFFGAGTQPDGSSFVVVELVELGTLTTVLHTRTDLAWVQKMSFALDTSRGMAHVHSLNRMHRDLKSGNLLVSSSMRVKVADFGTATLTRLAGREPSVQHIDETDTMSLSSEMHDPAARAQTVRTKGVGTPLWMAPEILAGRVYGPSADVYSFGVVLWEIGAQAHPWAHVPTQSFFMDELLRRIRLEERPNADTSAWPPSFVSLMHRAWATDPAARPSFAAAAQELEAMVV